MNHVIISPQQSRAARALLNMSLPELKTHGVGVNTVSRFETGTGSLRLDTMMRLVEVYRRLGVDFPDSRSVRDMRDEAPAKAAA